MTKKKRNVYKDALLLGEIIRKHRQRQGLSQAELAFKADINESYLSTIECGYSYISVSKLLNICDALELSPIQFMKEFVHEKEEYLKSTEAELLNQGYYSVADDEAKYEDKSAL